MRSRRRRWGLWLSAVALLLLGSTGLFGQSGTTTPPTNAAEQASPPDANGGGDSQNAGDAQGTTPAASDEPNGRPTTGPTTTPQPTPGAAIAAGHDVAVIPIEGMIYDFTLESLKRRIERALNNGATMLVIELDTPGGVVTSALDISSYIKSLQVPTVAWVNDQAYSAGTMLASACDEIVMAPAAMLGDSAPISPGQNLSPTERAKVVSPVLADYRSNATANDYDYTLFHAMTELGIEVYLVEHKETGQRELVNQADYAIMVQGRDPDAGGFGRLFGGGAGGGGGDDAEVKPEIATDEDRGVWEPVEQLPSGRKIANGRVHDGRTLLTMSQTEAMDVGLATAIIRNNNELRQHYSAASVVTVTPTWSEQLVGWLTHPVVKGVLVIGLLLGAYVEFQSPGLGVPGAVAVICLLALLGAPFLVGLAEIWHILLFILGLGLLIADLIFVIGFGVLGITGLVMMFAALILVSIPFGSGTGPTPQVVWDRLYDTTIFMILGLLVSLVGLFFITKIYGKLPLADRMVLAAGTDGIGRDRDAKSEPYRHITGDSSVGEGRVSVGQEGRVVSTGLRPSGRARIDGQEIDVVSVGPFIDPGRKIRVREVHGNRIVVEEA